MRNAAAKAIKTSGLVFMIALSAGSVRSECTSRISGQSQETNVLCGNLALEHGEFKAGMQRFLQVLRSDPSNFQARLGKGWAEFQLGQRETGLADLCRAHVLAPRSYDANLALATAYANIGRFDIAVKFYARAVKADPKKPDGFRGLGVSYAYLGDHAQAAKAYSGALTLLPASKRAEMANLVESESLAARPLPASGPDFSAPDGFTRSAERIIEKSRQNARLRGHDQVTTVDIARELALDQADGDIRFVFSQLAINPARLLAGVDRLAPDRKGRSVPKNIPFSPETMRTLLLAGTYAREYPSSFGKDPQTSSLHLLLAIDKTADASFKRFLDEQGINEASLHALIIDHYGVYAADRRMERGR